MPRNVWSRVSLVTVMVIVSAWSLYPLKRTINLGLDLQGGIHLVLGVETDKHVASQTDRAAEDLKATLERKGIAVKRIAREGDATVVVELASPQSWNDALTAASELGNFERRDEDQAAGRFKLIMSERVISRIRDDAVLSLEDGAGARARNLGLEVDRARRRHDLTIAECMDEYSRYNPAQSCGVESAGRPGAALPERAPRV